MKSWSGRNRAKPPHMLEAIERAKEFSLKERVKTPGGPNGAVDSIDKDHGSIVVLLDTGRKVTFSASVLSKI